VSVAALAQAVSSGRLILLIGVAIAALIVFGLLALSLRRRLLATEDPERGEAFDLETLQRQRRAGQITEEEFRTLRRALLGLPPEPAERGGDGEEPERSRDV